MAPGRASLVGRPPGYLPPLSPPGTGVYTGAVRYRCLNGTGYLYIGYPSYSKQGGLQYTGYYQDPAMYGQVEPRTLYQDPGTARTAILPDRHQGM